MNYLDKVAEFHTTFKAPVLDTPQLAPKERAALRIKLIQEELDELKEAIAKNDLVEVADALCDLQYVLSGTILEFGMKIAFDNMFAEVHRSNMSKACSTQDEADKTVEHYKNKGDDSFSMIDEETGRILVFRTSDRKTLKSINYSPADLKQFLIPTCSNCQAHEHPDELDMYDGLCVNCHEDIEINLADKNSDL